MVCFLNFKKNSRQHILPILTLFATLGLAPMTAVAQNAGNTPDMKTIKQELLSDPLFLSKLRDQLSAEEIGEDRVRKIVHDYLLENPDILIEMQKILATKISKERAESNEEIAATITENADMLFNAKTDAVFGNPKGDVTVLEFYDYNCGYCKSAFPQVKTLTDKDPNIRFVMKDYPILGEDSVKAHLVARAFQKLSPEKYLEFHKKMMTLDGRATEKTTLEVARSFGADADKLRSMMQDPEVQTPLVATAEVAYKLGINYTPSYIIGTEILPGAADSDALEEAVMAVRQKKQSGK